MLPSEVAATLRPVATSGLAGTRVAGGRSHPATYKLNDSATFGAQVAEVAEVATLSAPEMPCLACGGGAFVRSPGASWRCTDCEPVALPPAPPQGWALCDAGPADMTMTQLRAKRAAPVPLPRTALPPWLLKRCSSCAVGVRSVR